jgi:hypothetical protein
VADPKAPECGCRQPDCFACEIASLRTWLLQHGLHIVSEAERKVLEAMRGVDPWDLSDLSESNDCGDDLAGDLRKLSEAELSRRTP